MIPLKEWVDRALESVDVSACPADTRRSLALSSEVYLLSALKVARSLADRVCEAEEQGDGVQKALPMPGTGWTDRVVIHLSNNEGRQNIDGHDEDMQPLPFSPHMTSPDHGDSQTLRNSVSFHNVAGADFLLTPNNGNGCASDKMHCIYSLGIVFYMLFSGGDMPMDENGGNVFDPGGHSSTITAGRFFDLDGKLNILDEPDEVGDFPRTLGEDQLDHAEDRPRLPSRKKASRRGGLGRSVSVEQLKMKGLPYSICDLINNMIDCIYGDLSGDEAYQSMSDVCWDLQLMLDKPGRFLHDMDLERMSVAGLQLNEVMFNRDADFAALKDSYRRSIAGGNEFGVIVGASGIGKSHLANQLGSFVAATGGLFLKGKFDQLQQAKPFSALASAFNEYCVKILKEGKSNNLQEISSKLREILGNDAHHLVRVIPNLILILGYDENQQHEDQECVDAQKRLQYLLCQFVDVISRFSGAPILLFLDDTQWADPASISAINQLLLVPGSSDSKRQFFFLGCCREEGVLEEHPFGNMITSVNQFGAHATIIELDGIDKEAMNTMVSELLRLSPRLTRSLAEICHHKTKGSPLFFSQLMTSLYKDGLVRLSLSRRRWEWDEEKIQSRELPDDVASFMTSALGRLPKRIRTALCTLSFFGAQAACTLMEVLETKLGSELIEPLDKGVEEGLLNKINGVYSFSHDRLQEAAYNMIQPVDRCLYHFKYGVTLVPLALFIAASQINHGGPAAVEDAEQAVLIANLNLTAGHKAMEMSDFTAAFTFLDNGISFLRKGYWTHHYDLSLSLFVNACKCALAIGDIVSLKLLSEQVLTFAQNFEDTLEVLFMTVSSLADANQLPEAIEKSILVLSQLGEDFPASFVESETNLLIEQTKLSLQGFTDVELVDYKMMDDPSKIMALKFYSRLQQSFVMMKPAALPYITLKIVQLSITHGMSPISPIGFTYFGHLLAKLGNPREGCRYVKVAKELLDRIGSKEVAGNVFAWGTQIFYFLEPAQPTLEFHVHGHSVAMSAGDINGALSNSLFYVGNSFWSGVKLPITKERFAWACRLMEEYNHLAFLSQTIQSENNVSRLMGASGDAYRTNIQLGQDLQKLNPHAAMAYSFQKMYISFIFREFEQAKQYGEKFLDFNIHSSWTVVYIYTNFSFYGGLVSFWVYRQSHDPKWFARGSKAKDAMKKWAESCEWNFQSKLFLLEAEEAFCNNDFEHAESFYQKAISSARKHRFINDEALASELAGHFFLEREQKDMALKFFMQAHEKYNDWGAVGKCNALFQAIQEVFGTTSSLPSASSLIIDQESSDSKNGPKRMSDLTE